MVEVYIPTSDNLQVIKLLTEKLDGTLHEQWGESILTFDNTLGKGVIRFVNFDRGLALLDYDVYFEQEIKVTFKTIIHAPVEFIFISEGAVTYQSTPTSSHVFEQYQNIVISHSTKQPKTFIFPAKVPLKVNFIQVLSSLFLQKKNHTTPYLSNELLTLFSTQNTSRGYIHLGNFNLKIADRIRDLNHSPDHGITRMLSIEGQLNLILSMQILEHNNFVTGKMLPESLSKKDIKKIHELIGYIVYNISESMTVTSLANHIGFSPKKLQLGFRVLYAKSVNEYLQQLKLEIARDSIRTTNATISEIVYQIGFRNRSYFSKLFFQHYGILPTAYRKMVCKNQDNTNKNK